MVNHVIKENGIQTLDYRNINGLIRIPKHVNALKIYRCKFCPGEGMLFTGLSEAIFLQHITKTHSNKVARRKPEKLRGECRICGEVSATETELEEHINREHLLHRRAPFAGFGPREETGESGSGSEDERNRIQRISRASDSSQKEKKDQFIKDMRRTDQVSTRSRWSRRKRAESSDDENEDVRRDLQSSLARRKRRRLEDSVRKRSRPVPSPGRGEAGMEEGELSWSPDHPSRKKTAIGLVCCKYCSRRWVGEPEKAVLRQHREKHAEMITSTNECFQWECRACDFIIPYGEFRAWQSHVKSHESEKHIQRKRNTEKIQCSYCSDLLDEEVLKSHVMQYHLTDTFQCGNCLEIFPLKSQAVAHMEKKHGVSTRKAESLIVIPERLAAVSCLQCGWDCLGGGDREIESHVRLKHGTTDTSQVQHFCRLCGKNKAFRDQRRLEEHLVDHGGQSRAKRDSREERADWNRNSIKTINKHLTSSYSASGDNWSQRRREEPRDESARRSFEDPGRRHREEQEDRMSRVEDRIHRRSREEYPARREEGNGRGGRDGGFARGGRGGGNYRGVRGSGRGFPRGGRGGGFSRGGRGGGFPRGGRGRGGGYGGVEVRDRYPDKGEDWRCHSCGFQNYSDRMECYRCKTMKSDVPKPPQTNAMDDTRNEIELMMQQLQHERSAASHIVSDIIQPILDEVIDMAVLESEVPMDSQDSPAYQAPETDDEDAEMGSAEVRETVSYECTECQMKANDIFHVMMHLEEDHGVPEDEEILRSKVKEIKIKQ